MCLGICGGLRGRWRAGKGGAWAGAQEQIIVIGDFEVVLISCGSQGIGAAAAFARAFCESWSFSYRNNHRSAHPLAVSLENGFWPQFRR